MKETIKNFILNMGVDDVGFASVSDYHSPKSPQIEKLFPGAKSLIVMAFQELSSCESPSPQIAMNGRLDLMEFIRACNYKLARYLEKNFKCKAMTVSTSYPLDMTSNSGVVGEVSLRHAAVAAGLGTFGRHNLVIHPRLGTRVIFSCVLSDLDLSTDPQVTTNPCTNCNLCVANCPGGALDTEGQTNIMKCIKHSQPYGLGANIRFWLKFANSSAEEQKNMLRSENYASIYQAGFIGFQYFCFNCYKSCPVGRN